MTSLPGWEPTCAACGRTWSDGGRFYGGPAVGRGRDVQLCAGCVAVDRQRRAAARAAGEAQRVCGPCGRAGVRFTDLLEGGRPLCWDCYAGVPVAAAARRDDDGTTAPATTPPVPPRAPRSPPRRAHRIAEVRAAIRALHTPPDTRVDQGAVATQLGLNSATVRRRLPPGMTWQEFVAETLAESPT
jgi:hypothetical protein